MPGYSRVPKLVNAITKTVVKATMGSGAKPAVKKPFPKPVKPTLKKSSPAIRAKTDAIQKSSVKVKPAAKANKLVSNLKNTKPMENVPKDVSNRFNATVKKLAAESVKKNRGK